MAVKKIVQIGDGVLRQKAKPVSLKNKVAIKKLLKDLTDSLHAAPLVGIAAPQIGLGLQVFLSEIRKTKLRDAKQVDSLRVFINPKIVNYSNKQTILVEGCGSLCHASIFGPVKRPSEVEVLALDENLKPFHLKANGLLAKIIQHEYDHLQGVVILDKFTDTRKCWVRSAK